MTLTELRYIVAVARERHFGRAADRCFVSQPTLSMGVKRLEDELNVKIFERKKNEVSLTLVGTHIVDQAQRVLEEAERIHSISSQHGDPLSGSLSLGAIYTVGPYVLPSLIPKIKKRAPDMPLIIEEGYTAALSEKLKRGVLDVILLSLPYEEPGIVTWPIYDEPFVVMLPKGHEWLKRDTIVPNDLADLNLLMLGPGHCFRDQVLQACPDCNRSAASEHAQHNLEGSSLETIRMMVASGIGSTVLPYSATQHQQVSKALAEIREFSAPPPQRRVALAWRKSFHRKEAIQLLYDTLSKQHIPGITMLHEPAPFAV